jgi:glycosyltransferase involved in cell wall biosynthesis
MLRILLLCLAFVLPLSGAEKKTVCLNMIVKNETAVITRCLESVKPIIDYWVIVDTGSSDGTQELIKTYMKDIPGELHERPWKNFEHNRNEALELARGKADYLLIMDADDMLEFDPGFTMPPLSAGAYRVSIKYGGMSYTRLQLIATHLPWKWKGVIHEVLTCDAAHQVDSIDQMRYVVRGGGARSQDPQKFLKDAMVLEEALKNDPTSTRYTFYLAQSYRDAGEKEKSLSWYEKRVAMGGWEEEVFWSLLQIAQLQQSLKKPIETVIETYYRAHRLRPHRSEPIYHLAEIFNQQGRNDLAYEIIKSKKFIKAPTQKDVLFVQDWIDDYGLLFQLSICSYYVGEYQESLDACDQLLQSKTLPEGWRRQVQVNRVFPQEKLSAQARAAECCAQISQPRTLYAQG